MAYIDTMYCHKCKRTVQVVLSAGMATPDVCGSCASQLADEKRRQHFRGLDGLTIEERLRKLEQWVYDYKVPIDSMSIRF